MNNRYVICACISVVGIGFWLSNGVLAQQSATSGNQASKPVPRAMTITKASSNRNDADSLALNRHLADRLGRHCASCNHLAMDRYESPWATVEARMKTVDDYEFEMMIRRNFLDNYQAGNIRGPFHVSEGVCICGHAHDLNTQKVLAAAKRQAEAQAALFYINEENKRLDEQQRDPAYQKAQELEELKRQTKLIEEGNRKKDEHNKEILRREENDRQREREYRADLLRKIGR
jgi:hypothetical protein